MNESQGSGRVVEVASLREYFCGALKTALAHQHVAVADQTQHYVVNLLTLFSRSDALYDKSDGANRHRPLAFMLMDALDAGTPQQRVHALQRLGDVSLFVAGFFAGGFARRLIDVDYHIAMGGRAYGSLADSLRGSRAVLSRVYAELAAKFQPLVDALNEVSDDGRAPTQRDVLRLYEIWLKTGSARAQRLLRGLGVEAAPGARSAFQH